jgi:hypothetical protein
MAFSLSIAANLALGAAAALAAGPDPGVNVTVTNTRSNPVPVTGSLGVTGGVTINNPESAPIPVAGVVGAIPLLPTTAFTIPPQQLSIALAGSSTQPVDPSGTRYAISSITVTNPTPNSSEVVLVAIAFNFSTTDCGFLANEVARAAAPKIAVPPQATVQLTFPQPYVTAAVAGPHVCLSAGGGGYTGMTWSAVGYKILP